MIDKGRKCAGAQYVRCVSMMGETHRRRRAEFTKLVFCMLFKPLTLLKRETPTQVFSYEYCGMFKNSFFIEYLQ